MKIWYDACTGKHIRYGTAIARRLRQRGHEVLLTTRDHPDTLPLARILGEKPVVVGKYSPHSLFSRLEESANRVIKFSRMFEGNMPDYSHRTSIRRVMPNRLWLGNPDNSDRRYSSRNSGEQTYNTVCHHCCSVMFYP